MPQVDIAHEASKVGNALATVRIDQMILNLAKGIAWGQYELDKVGVDITKMMGVPGTVAIGDDQISMLEAGFVPSFYHFVDTILELKMEVNIREEQTTSITAKQSSQRKISSEVGAEMSSKLKVKGGIFLASVTAEAAAKASWKRKSSAAYSRSLDASHSQKFNQDLSASSSMRTKLVPIPAPEVLVERIRILLEKLRLKAEAEMNEALVFSWELDEDVSADTIKALDNKEITAELRALFENKDDDGNAGPYVLSDEAKVQAKYLGMEWFIKDASITYLLVKDEEKNKLNAYKPPEDTEEGKKEEPESLEEKLAGQVQDRLLSRFE